MHHLPSNQLPMVLYKADQDETRQGETRQEKTGSLPPLPLSPSPFLPFTSSPPFSPSHHTTPPSASNTSTSTSPSTSLPNPKPPPRHHRATSHQLINPSESFDKHFTPSITK
ncbi:hypothetical protein EAF00_005295 [Botryotinia globosa]|nr:hypothetical protein EAF00_005295 [Botryotinia globosa]